MKIHINHSISVISQWLFLISQLKNQGLFIAARQNYFTPQNSVPSFDRFLSSGDIACLNAVFMKSLRCGIIDSLFLKEDLTENSCYSSIHSVSFAICHLRLLRITDITQQTDI